MAAEGVDYSVGRPDPVALVAAGKSFVVRYVSPSSYKNLDVAERDALHAAGMGICLVWENRSTDALRGAAGGAADAYNARKQARALGFPDTLPIYHAVDFDATAAQLAGPVRDYFAAAVAQHGGTHLVGAYGGLHTVTYLIDHGLVGFGWQTYAWSGGRWDPRAQLQQYRNGVQVAGADCDLDRAMTADYGQWGGTTMGTPAENAIIATRDGMPQVDGHVNCPVVWQQNDEAWQRSVDDQLAAIQAALTGAPAGALSDADVARIAIAVADENARRQQA